MQWNRNHNYVQCRYQHGLLFKFLNSVGMIQSNNVGPHLDPEVLGLGSLIHMSITFAYEVITVFGGLKSLECCNNCLCYTYSVQVETQKMIDDFIHYYH